MNLLKYYADVEFVPDPGYEFHGELKKEGACSLGSIDSFKQGDVGAEVLQKSYQGPNASFKDSDWRTFAGPFIAISVINVPWVVEDAMPAPEAKMKAFKLVPDNRVGHPKKGGIVDVDDEVIARGEGTYVRNGGDLMAYGPPIQLTSIRVRLQSSQPP